MKDIFVLILVAIFIVANAYAQMKKKQMPQPAESQDNSQDEWDDPEVTVQISSPKDFPKKREATEHTFFPESEGGRIFRHEPKKAVEKPIKKKVFDAKQFSLKRALIYSEILNRKYT